MVTKEEVLAIAKLARLSIADSELERFTGEFNLILDYVRQLEKLDLASTEPMSHVHGAANVFREDQVVPELTAAEALQNAPDVSGSLFRVPLIIDQSGEH